MCFVVEGNLNFLLELGIFIVYDIVLDKVYEWIFML